MALAYVFSLVVALGVLLVQIAMGGKGDADAGHGDAAGHDHGGGNGGPRALGRDVSADGSDGEAQGDVAAATDVLGFFLSLRFWIFSALGFGLSGSMLTLFALAGPIVVFILAASSGIVSGLFASFAFRFVAQSSASSTADITRATGSIGRVLVPVGKGKVGQIRIVLKGQTVDLRATSDDEEFARGEHVLVEDVEESVARVSKRPSELA